MLYSLSELYRQIAPVSPMLEEKGKNSDEDPWNLVFNAAFFSDIVFLISI